MKRPFSSTISELSAPWKRGLLALHLLLLALLLPAPTHAQEMTVKSLVLDPSDVTANLSENLIQDNNGDYAGLVKVKLAATGATFEGLVLKQQVHSASEYWVFMAKNSYRLQVVVPGYLPLDINFRKYGVDGIESRRTYVLTITVPQVGVGQEDDGMRYFVLTVKPDNAIVFLDNKPQQVSNGQMSVLLSQGSHSYSVSAPGYATEDGTVNIAGQRVERTVSLQSVLAKLEVTCPNRGTQVYVNDTPQGSTPWLGDLPAGSYRVELRLDGYHPQQQSVTLAERENKTLSFPSLTAITGKLNVNYLPSGSEVYIDGKKVGTTPDVFRNILVGNRNVEIRKEGYETMKKIVAVKENEQASLSGTLRAVANSEPLLVPVSNGDSSSSDREVFTVNGVSFTMVRVEGGTFTMGATAEQGSDAQNDEKPAHEVTLSTYMIGETEVTQALWQAVMGRNPSEFKSNSQNPVEMVSWEECKEFINKLNSLTGKSFRMPTEAEWEYAARGGNKSKHYKYSGSNNPEDVAWYGINSGSMTHPVMSKSPNELGIFDMSGNVWEWCEDWYGEDYYKSSPQANPKGPLNSSYRSYRVCRGCCCFDVTLRCRVSSRGGWSVDGRDHDLGLRLAL